MTLPPDSIASSVGHVLDQVISEFGADEPAADIADARIDYDKRRGRVFEDEDLWEHWSQAFLEWYVLERVRAGDSLPPAARLLDHDAHITPQPPLGADDLTAVRALLRSHRSLFSVASASRGAVQLHDLIGGARFVVDEQRALHGVEAGDVVEARLVGFGQRVSFTRTFCFHPHGTRAAIAQHIAQFRSEGISRLHIIDHIAHLRVKCERYKHMTPEKIYELGSSRP